MKRKTKVIGITQTKTPGADDYLYSFKSSEQDITHLRIHGEEEDFMDRGNAEVSLWGLPESLEMLTISNCRIRLFLQDVHVKVLRLTVVNSEVELTSFMGEVKIQVEGSNACFEHKGMSSSWGEDDDIDCGCWMELSQVSQDQ